MRASWLLLLAGCANWRAPELCQELVDEMCANVETACTPSIDADECVEQLALEFPCEKAIDVTRTFEECLARVRESDGCVLDDVPAECDAGVIFREQDLEP